MHPTPRKLRAWAGTLLLALVPAACAERGSPVAPEPAQPPARLEATLECRASKQPLEVVCAEPAGLSGDARALVVGATPHTRLVSSNVLYTAATGEYAFDVTVTNLIPQPLGTTSGTVPSPAGVRVFFEKGPVVAAGSGTVSVANADGRAVFFAAGDTLPYFQYSGGLLGSDGILATAETSGAKRWILNMPPTVEYFTFTVNVWADVPHEYGWIDVTPSLLYLRSGSTLQLSSQVRDARGTPLSGAAVAWSTSSSSIALVDTAGKVTAVEGGTATITATTDGKRTGSAVVHVCPTMAVGEVHRPRSGPALVCLGGGASGAEYVVVPVNTASYPMNVTVTGTGTAPVAGALSARLAGGAGLPVLGASRISALRAADGFEQRLREREAAELTPLIPAARRAYRAKTAGAGARRVITRGVPAVGERMSLNAQGSTSCTSSTMRTGHVKVVGAHVIVMADSANPAGGLTTADYQEIADRFDTLVWPTLTGASGPPADLDENGRVIVFFTSAVNALTPAGSAPLSHGVTLKRDLFPTSACPTSNQGEMILMAAADPAGTVNGNARSVASVKAAAARTLGHELAHLVNVSRRLDVNHATVFEQVWLDEGLAYMAEELLFYAASGRQPGQNLGSVDVTGGGAAAFLAYAEPNFTRLSDWLRAPSERGMVQTSEHPATRGAAWAFLGYLADRESGNPSSVWGVLVNSTTAGSASIEAVTGAAMKFWTRDFAASMYADDAPFGATAHFTRPSWNFRSVFSALDYDGNGLGDGYPLAHRDLVDGANRIAMASGGGTAYLRMGVAANNIASVGFQNDDGTLPTTFMVTVTRVK